MRFLFGSFFFIASVASTSLFAEQPVPVEGVCNEYLTSSHYEKSKVFGTHEPSWALKPELGSIEDERPGVIAELMSIRHEFRETYRAMMSAGPVPPKDVIESIDLVKRRLFTLQLRHAEPRLHAMVEQVLPYLSHEQTLATTNSFTEILKKTMSKMWELTIACFFDGEEIYLGQRVADLFPREYQKAQTAPEFSIVERPEWGREIDVAIRNWNGTWHWVEVKDWGQFHSLRFGHKRKIESQSYGQNIARYLLRNQDIELSLALKYGIPAKDLAEYREFHFDNIYFTFPEGVDRAAQ